MIVVLALASGCGGVSAGADAGVDVASDLATDVAADTAPDIAPDAAPDVATDAPTDVQADAPSDAPFVTAPHDPLPVIPDLGGPRLRHPAVVTVTFAGDTRRAALEASATWIVGSSWLPAVGADYGVGAGTVAGAVQLASAAPAAITDAEIARLLAAGLADGSIPRPASGLADALYLMYFPAGTVITLAFTDSCAVAQTAHSCTEFGAYHLSTRVEGVEVAYAVMPDCGPGGGDLTGLSALEAVEVFMSHELIEAATDPAPLAAPAFQGRGDLGDAWERLFGCGVEVADLCELPLTYVRDGSHVATRSWSNTEAAAGRDPCIPVDSERPYFNVSATPATTQHAAPGAVVDFQLRAWSTAPVPDWTLSATSVGYGLGRPTIGAYVTPTSVRLNNGMTTTLHLHMPTNIAPGSSATFMLLSTSAMGTHVYPIAVTSP